MVFRVVSLYLFWIWHASCHGDDLVVPETTTVPILSSQSDM
jgi:hypothetical protein